MLLGAVLSSFVVASCITRGYRDSVEIRADSRLEKLRIADSIVNDDYLRHLRSELKVLLPDVREEELGTLSLERMEQQLPQSTASDAAEMIRVIVSVKTSGNRDPMPIVQAAVGIVKTDIDRVRRTGS